MFLLILDMMGVSLYGCTFRRVEVPVVTSQLTHQPYSFLLYSLLLSSGSDIVRLSAKRSAKSRAPKEIAHTGSCMHVLKSCVCVLTSSPCQKIVKRSIVLGMENADNYHKMLPNGGKYGDCCM